MEAPVKVRPPQASLSGGLLLSGGVPPGTDRGRHTDANPYIRTMKEYESLLGNLHAEACPSSILKTWFW